MQPSSVCHFGKSLQATYGPSGDHQIAEYPTKYGHCIPKGGVLHLLLKSFFWDLLAGALPAYSERYQSELCVCLVCVVCVVCVCVVCCVCCECDVCVRVLCVVCVVGGRGLGRDL